MTDHSNDPAADGLDMHELSLLRHVPHPEFVAVPAACDFRTARAALPGARFEETEGRGAHRGRAFLHVRHGGPARDLRGRIVAGFHAIYPERGGPAVAFGPLHPRQLFLDRAAEWHALSVRARRAVLAVHAALHGRFPESDGYILLGRWLDGAAVPCGSLALAAHLRTEMGIVDRSPEARERLLQRLAPEPPHEIHQALAA